MNEREMLSEERSEHQAAAVTYHVPPLEYIFLCCRCSIGHIISKLRYQKLDYFYHEPPGHAERRQVACQLYWGPPHRAKDAERHPVSPGLSRGPRVL